MKITPSILPLIAALLSTVAIAGEKPNIILVYADDISARELPIYGSSVWSQPTKGDTSHPRFRAKTPVLDQMAAEGCWVKTAWASVVCSPSRAMMMTGRYAHLHKWWNNKDKGKYRDASGKLVTWPLYESSPTLIGHIAQQAGYGTYWAGKTQMAGDLRKFGFDQGCFTPGNLSDKDNPFTDFTMHFQKEGGKKLLINTDSGQPIDTYMQHGWYFNPHVRLMNHGDQEFQWWPNTAESKESFEIGTYGPDVELDFIFDFMQRQHDQEKPFFVYHTTHLGHDAYDWLDPESESSWPGTPVVRWDGNGYTRTEPTITGDKGVYETNGTVTEPGIHSHINYLDYQMWLYRNKLKEMRIEDNTVVIFCADNGTSGYGKNSSDRQKGTHVPLIIYAPGMTKHGEQDVLVNMSDMLPTIAELAGVEIPSDYEVNGESLVPFLMTDQSKHREWIYGYNGKDQIIRGDFVMKDGRDKWWNVAKYPDDLISFDPITDWDSVTDEHRAERDRLKRILPRFDVHATQHDSPGVKLASSERTASPTRTGWSPRFRDNFEDRALPGENYTTARGTEDAWTIVDGVLVGNQTNDDHGAVIRTKIDFDDVDITFDFRFRGGKSFNLVIDDKNDPTVHAGHICRVSVFPKRLIVSDDKTGGMNLEVRQQRRRSDLSEQETDALNELLDRTRSSKKVDIKPGQWHELRVRIKGDVMKAFLDGKPTTMLRSPGFAHPTKTQFGFTVNGSNIEFDHLKVLRPQTDN